MLKVGIQQERNLTRPPYNITVTQCIMSGAGIKDLVQLKLQKRLVEEKLKKNNAQMEKMGHILDKKMTQRVYQIAPEDAVTLSNGLLLSLSDVSIDGQIPFRSEAIPSLLLV